MFSAFWAWLRELLFGKHLDISLIGLPSAGKTTLTNVLTEGKYEEHVAPTVGFNLRQMRSGNVTIKLWDIGGQPRFRSMWERYCMGASAIVFLADASEPRFEHAQNKSFDNKAPGSHCQNRNYWAVACEELHTLISQHPLKGIPLLVLATKNDLPDCATTSQVIHLLKLAQIRDREVFCYSISSRNMQNIDLTLQWLCARKGQA